MFARAASRLFPVPQNCRGAIEETGTALREYNLTMLTRREFVPGVLSSLASGKRYRVALIGDTGHGNFGHDWDLAFNSLPNTEVVAVADPDERGRARAVSRSRARKEYPGYVEMLRAEKPDIVAICPRWADQRLPMITAAAEAGAHILVEKPLARDLADADRIVEVVERRGVKLQVGHTARPLAVTGTVRAMLREGRLGQLLEIRARGKEDRRAGGEDMIVLGTHCFDLMRYFAGDPDWVFANVTQNGRDVNHGMEHEATEPVGAVAGDEVAAMFQFHGGVHGYFASRRSDVVDGERFGVTLYCSRAVVYLPLSAVPSAPPYLLRRAAWAGGEWERIEYPAGKPIPDRAQTNAIMAADLIEAIETGRDSVCSVRDGRWTVEMIAGIYQSHYAGARLAFPLKKR
jgi:predicted dehydrogenase